MANNEQVEILKQGVEAWNALREKYPETEIDLKGASLGGTNLNGANLSGANLYYANLENASLSGASLNNANLGSAKLSEANLSSASLNNANLGGAKLSEANLSSASLNSANLRNADLRNADLSNTNFIEADMCGANISKANLVSSDLSFAKLFDVSLCGAKVFEAKLCEADLSSANLSGTELNHSDLSGVRLCEARLETADLSDTELTSSDLSRVEASGCKFRNSKLNGASLRNADLSFTDFSGSDLTNVNMTCVQAISANFNKSNLSGACIEDWNINSKTKFENIICHYTYISTKYIHGDEPIWLFEERRPRVGAFKEGEFAALVQKTLDTIDLIYIDGIDWQVFFLAFQELRSSYVDADLIIQAIEKKKNGEFVVRLESNSEVDRGTIETRAKELYDVQLKLREAQGEIKVLREMSDVLKQLAGKAISQPSNQTTINAQTIGVQSSGSGDVRHFSQTLDNENRQTPAESAKEIQDLLIQLKSTNPTNIEAVFEQKVTSDPVLRDKIKNALKEGGLETMKVIFPLIGIAIESIRGWLKAEGELAKGE